MFHRRKGLPDDWDLIAADRFAMWNWFTIDERADLADNADWLLRHKHWEAANHFELSDEIVTTIAIEAAVLVLGLGWDYYEGVSAIIVFPTTIVSRGEFAGPVPGTITAGPVSVLGQTHNNRGAILIAWDEARRAARHPGSGHNVVFHEFAHKLDMLDDIIDGTPPLDSKEELARWVEVCTPLYERLRDGGAVHPLDPYGGTDPAEFFAVATETFFDAPVELEAHQPALFEVLKDFYKQDPSTRARRATQTPSS